MLDLWRLLNSEITHDAARNMAIEEALLQAKVKKAVPPTLRFWRNNRAVVIGYSQKIRAEVNLELCERERIQVIRRFSGGGAVYHDLGNLNYTVVLDTDHPLLRNLDIVESYEILCSGLTRGLKVLGITTNFAPPSDVLIHGRKISGSAQSRRRNVVLHHGTLLVDSDLLMLKSVLMVHHREMRSKSTSVWKPITRLKDELDRKISITEVKWALIQGFGKAFGVRLKSGELTSLEDEIAQKLYRTKYSLKEWNFWR